MGSVEVLYESQVNSEVHFCSECKLYMVALISYGIVLQYHRTKTRI